MPCSDGGASDYYQHQDEASRLYSKIDKLEAALCAVFSDLVLRGMLDKVIETASLAGGINLRKLYEDHKEDDEKRLGEKLDAFSLHEQAILFSLLRRRAGEEE